jgi:hypothetical protein
MEKKCLVCDMVFEGRSDARTCSDKCKKSFQRIKGTEGGQDGSVKDGIRGTFVKGDNPELVERGQKVSEKKLTELKGTILSSISPDEPCNVFAGGKEGEVYLDLEKDLYLDLKRDLGIYSWTKDGIFVSPDITIQQVRNIRRLVEAKKGWPHRTYDDENPVPYSTSKVVGL